MSRMREGALLKKIVLAGALLAVVAVSIDRGGAKVVRPFAERLGLRHMGLYHDAKAALFKAFGVSGLPTTFVIDRRGRIVGAYPGPGEWSVPEARALVESYPRQPADAAAIETEG